MPAQEMTLLRRLDNDPTGPAENKCLIDTEVSIDASRTNIRPGESVQIAWSIQPACNNVSATLNGDSISTQGQRIVNPTQSVEYHITLKQGTESAYVNVPAAIITVDQSACRTETIAQTEIVPTIETNIRNGLPRGAYEVSVTARIDEVGLSADCRFLVPVNNAPNGTVNLRFTLAPRIVDGVLSLFYREWHVNVGINGIPDRLTSIDEDWERRITNDYRERFRSEFGAGLTLLVASKLDPGEFIASVRPQIGSLLLVYCRPA